MNCTYIVHYILHSCDHATEMKNMLRQTHIAHTHMCLSNQLMQYVNVNTYPNPSLQTRNLVWQHCPKASTTSRTMDVVGNVSGQFSLGVNRRRTHFTLMKNTCRSYPEYITCLFWIQFPPIPFIRIVFRAT